MSNGIPITKNGILRLEKELHHLKTIERPAVIKAIAEARAHGDISENAEYHAAKEKQGFIEAKIKDLDTRMANAHVIDVSSINSEHVQFGATVHFVDEETDVEIRYTLVSDYEANLDKGHISHSSPVARAAMGKKVGDSIEINTPKGTKYFAIIKVEYTL